VTGVLKSHARPFWKRLLPEVKLEEFA
jgi:hypothetical protein